MKIRSRYGHFLSKAIIEEFLEITEEPKVAKYTNQQDITVFLGVLGKTAKIIPMKSRFKIVEEDPDDDIIVRTAYDGKANYIVSGDKHLLALKEFKGIKIVTIDETLKELSNQHLSLR